MVLSKYFQVTSQRHGTNFMSSARHRLSVGLRFCQGKTLRLLGEGGAYILVNSIGKIIRNAFLWEKQCPMIFTGIAGSH